MVVCITSIGVGQYVSDGAVNKKMMSSKYAAALEHVLPVRFCLIFDMDKERIQATLLSITTRDHLRLE